MDAGSSAESSLSCVRSSDRSRRSSDLTSKQSIVSVPAIHKNLTSSPASPLEKPSSSSEVRSDPWSRAQQRYGDLLGQRQRVVGDHSKRGRISILRSAST